MTTESGAPTFRRPPLWRRLSFRVAVLLSIMGMVPLISSIWLVGNISEVAHNYSQNQMSLVLPKLDVAREILRKAVLRERHHYQMLVEHLFDEAKGTPERLPELLAGWQKSFPEIVSASWQRETSDGPPHEIVVMSSQKNLLGVGLQLRISVDDEVNAAFAQLGNSRKDAGRMGDVSQGLPNSLRVGFVLVMALVVVVTILFGVLWSRRITSRIKHLAIATQVLAQGETAARVKPAGTDEISQLGKAFNEMAESLAESHAQVAYLQRMNAWQEVARHLAHEIKNPLTPITLSVEELAASYRGEDDKHRQRLIEVRDIVKEEAGDLIRLVDSFRMLGSLPPAVLAKTTVYDVVQEAVREKGEGLVDLLVASPDAKTASALADRLLLRRVFANLIENAIQAGVGHGRAGKTVVTISVAPQKITVQIDDEGAGIAEKTRSKLFEPYFTSKTGGTGLGLAISKKIVLDLHGEIVVSNQPSSLGGARFTVILPALT